MNKYFDCQQFLKCLYQLNFKYKTKSGLTNVQVLDGNVQCFFFFNVSVINVLFLTLYSFPDIDLGVNQRVNQEVAPGVVQGVAQAVTKEEVIKNGIIVNLKGTRCLGSDELV